MLRSQPGPAVLGFSVVSGGLTGCVLTASEIALYRYRARLRRLPLVAVIILRTMLYGLVFFGVPLVVIAAMSRVADLPAQAVERMLGMSNIYVFVGVSAAFNIVFVLRRLIGPSTFRALVTGRYHRPRSEERVVMFLDLRGSTALAERLGDAQFLDLLDRVVYDLSDPVVEAGGDIYRYVGDEVIVTWPAETGAHDGACVTCLFAIEAALASRRDDYLREFGAEPRLRGALHIGSLMVGIIGDYRTEIVMLGDTMNTTARIEDACRTTGHDFIASGPLLQRIGTLPAGIAAKPLGPMPLRGKEAALDLFALERG
jgi:adenylate cyclase